MELIVPHNRTDFDAFASMICAKKIHPEAQPVLPADIIFKLREVLSLYRDTADFPNIRFLRKKKNTAIDRVIVVDTKKKGQLLDFMPYISRAESRIFYDHHPPTSDDLTGDLLEQFPYGANATGLFFKLMDQGLTLSPQEATLTLLGIYADTGNLTYPGTTARDVLAASMLLELDADLQTVNHYLRPHFDPAQRTVFRDMLAGAREIILEGYHLYLIQIELEQPMRGTPELLAQASDMLGADAIVGVFSAKNKDGVQITIQSLTSAINAGRIASYFDGGGHPGSASAFLPKADMAGVADTVLTLLTEAPLPTTKVKDVMTPNVLTIDPDAPLSDTAERLKREGVKGAPVVDSDGRLMGVISLRDAAKAEIRNLLHAKTKGFMSDKIETVSPETPLITARKIISSRDIGRLPVLEEDRLVGIITRSDILGAAESNGEDELSAAAG